MAKLTEVQKFKRMLAKRFFKTSKDSNYSYFMLEPCAYRCDNGDKIVTGNIAVMILGGSDTPAGELGCVSMEYLGKIKPYRSRHASSHGAILRKAFVAKDAKHAIAEYGKWHETIKETRKTWKQIL